MKSWICGKCFKSCERFREHYCDKSWKLPAGETLAQIFCTLEREMQEQYYKLALRVAKLEDRINKEWGSQCNTCGHIKKAEAVVEGCQAVSEPETASMCEFTGKCTCKPLAVQVA